MKTIEKKTIEKTKTTYEGKVNNIISAEDFYSKTNTEDIGNNLVEGNTDLTFLKFNHNGKTLLVSDRNIKNKISWDQLNERNLVFGKTIEINNIKYRVRLLTSNEWDKLIVKYTPLDRDSHWENMYSWCQNVYSIDYLKRYYSSDLASRVICGSSTVSHFNNYSSSYVDTADGWRPCLEIL